MTSVNYKVYCHTTPNNKKYIGITQQSVKKRWQNGRHYAACSAFNRAIKKYGWDNIKHEILWEGLNKKEAEIKEIELIIYHKTTNNNYGYNIEDGGNASGAMSEETKKKLRNKALGRRHNAETKLKLSKINKGKILSENTKEKIRHAISKKVKQINLETGNLIKVFNSAIMASHSVAGKYSSHISEVCNGKRISAYGYKWEWG